MQNPPGLVGVQTPATKLMRDNKPFIKMLNIPPRPGLAKRLHAVGHKFQYSCLQLGPQETDSEWKSRPRSLVEEDFQKIHLQGSEESRFGQQGNKVGTAVTNSSVGPLGQ